MLSRLLSSRRLGAALAAAVLTLAARAADTGSAGLLGSRYAAATFGYVDLAGTGYDARTYGFEYNHDLTANLDARVELDYLRSEGLGGAVFGGKHYSYKTATLGGRAFTDWRGGRVYAEAGAGYVWFRAPAGIQDNSWLWSAGVGAEFALAPRFALTPFVRYEDAVDFETGAAWNYGLRAAYALTGRVALTATVQRDDDRNTTGRAGVVFRF